MHAGTPARDPLVLVSVDMWSFWLVRSLHGTHKLGNFFLQWPLSVLLILMLVESMPGIPCHCLY
jgi:hypothetical protein